MTDGHDELAGGFVVVNAIDHAASAEGQTHTAVVPGAAGYRIAEVEETVLLEYQTVGGCFGHGEGYPDFPRWAIHKKLIASGALAHLKKAPAQGPAPATKVRRAKNGSGQSPTLQEGRDRRTAHTHGVRWLFGRWSRCHDAMSASFNGLLPSNCTLS